MRFDNIIIGSSPLSLVEASYRAHRGESVLLIEKEDRIGGAWRTYDFFGMHGLEHSPHFLFPDQYAYKALEEYLWADLEEVAASPLLAYTTKSGKNIITPIEQTTKFYIYKALFASLASKKKKMRNFVKMLSKDLPHRNTYKRSMYFKTGLHSWLNTVYKNLKKKGVSLLMNTTIENVEINKDIVFAKSGENLFEAKRIVMNANTFLSSLKVDDIDINIPYKEGISTNITYLYRGLSTGIGFTLFFGNTGINLFNDVTPYTPQIQDPRLRLLNIRVDNHQSTKTMNNDHAIHFFNTLKNIGWIDSENLLDIKVITTHRNVINKKFLRKFNNTYSKRAYFFFIQDFSMSDALRDWYLNIKLQQHGSM